MAYGKRNEKQARVSVEVPSCLNYYYGVKCHGRYEVYVFSLLACLFACLFACLPARLFICKSVCLSVCGPALSVCLPVC